MIYTGSNNTKIVVSGMSLGGNIKQVLPTKKGIKIFQNYQRISKANTFELRISLQRYILMLSFSGFQFSGETSPR